MFVRGNEKSGRRRRQAAERQKTSAKLQGVGRKLLDASCWAQAVGRKLLDWSAMCQGGGVLRRRCGGGGCFATDEMRGQAMWMFTLVECNERRIKRSTATAVATVGDGGGEGER